MKVSSEAEIGDVVTALARRLLEELRSGQAPFDLVVELRPSRCDGWGEKTPSGSNAADVPPFQMTDQLTVCAVRKTLAAVCGESGTWDLCAKELQTVGSRLIENRFDFLLKGVHRTKHASHVYEIASPRHLG